MTPPDTDASSQGLGYIRGGGGVEVDSRRVLRVLGFLAVIALLGSAAALAVSGADQNSRTGLLHGAVRVPATVSGCEGISSGIGMGIEYWNCQASYTFAGRHYDELIGGSRTRLVTGQAVELAVAPSRPTIVTTVREAQRKSAGWTVYVAPLVLVALAVALAVPLAVRRRRAGGPQKRLG